MKKFKLRAECFEDLMKFMKKSGNHIFEFNTVSIPNASPEVELEFESDLSLQELILDIRTIEDSHVMFQTVQHIEKYTGERNFDIN